MVDIKLFVCCHQQVQVPKHPLLLPIQVGAALSDTHFPGFLHDDSDGNISEKNRSYCELTAQYWAWKNVKADYYGFFHYRRYLYPGIRNKLPYRIEREADSKILTELGYGGFAEMICQYDLISPAGEDMYIPVREHYANAPHHRRRDIELMERIVQERCPEMSEAIDTYLSGTVCYFGNIYIMRRQVFHHYCSWLFPLLEEFDRQTDLTGYSIQEQRVDGYLAERLFGIYLANQKNTLKTMGLPRVHFYSGREYYKRKILNSFFPPGSKRRSMVKAMRRT